MPWLCPELPRTWDCRRIEALRSSKCIHVLLLLNQSVQHSILFSAAWEILALAECDSGSLFLHASRPGVITDFIQYITGHIQLLLYFAALRAASHSSFVSRSPRLCLCLHARQRAGQASLTRYFAEHIPFCRFRSSSVRQITDPMVVEATSSHRTL
jgi:hypothetical protein